MRHVRHVRHASCVAMSNINGLAKRGSATHPAWSVKAAETEAVRRLLDELAHQVRCLVPCHRDPERFHRDKSDISYALRRIAAGLGRS
jgi:hypothetical protein